MTEISEYRLEVYRDVFTEAQPENTTGGEIWGVSIYDKDNELIDLDTGYATEAEARVIGEGCIANLESRA